MKRALLVIIVTAVVLTISWITSPKLFPDFPKPVAEYLAMTYGVTSAEDIADLEILIGLSISIAGMSVLGLFAWLLLRRKR